MTYERPPYVPSTYVASATHRALVWKCPDAAAEPCEALVDDVIGAVEALLDFRIQCRLHVVIYASNSVACAELDRPVPANMLLTPLQSSSDCVIAVQSAGAHPLNADLERMRRLLAHEVVHVAVALHTKSEKRLGDGNRAMRVRTWMNEGLACVVATLATDRVDLIEREVTRSAGAALEDLDRALDDLVDERRSLAFAIATERVWRAVQTHGLPRVFHDLLIGEMLRTDSSRGTY